MDLKKWNKDVNILYLLDLFSRFTTARIIKDKKPSTIIDNVMQMWIGSGFGAPQKFLADNGGEFANEDFRNMCGNLNIQVLNTAAESPWQNGICERNHAVVDRCLEKILADNPTVSLETALVWAINAKNCLQMWNGFSSYQLVFGQNPNLPNVMRDLPPALEGTTMNQVFAKHINTLHAARRAYIEAESSSKIRRALKHKIKVNCTQFDRGCKVFYKRDESNKWKGPGTVIGQDGKIVFVRHGNVYVRVSTNRLIKVGHEFQEPTESDPGPEIKVTSGEANCIRESSDEESTNQRQHADVAIHDGVQLDDATLDQNMTDNVTGMPKKNDEIRYKQPGDNIWREATIISRAGKATGKYSSWYNVKHPDEENPICIDFQSIDKWKKVEKGRTEEVNIVLVPQQRHCDKDVITAKEREIQNWKDFEVFEEVRNSGQKTISTTWVITEKKTGPEHFVKARLVARGFEEEQILQVDSPTALKSTLRILIAISSIKEWQCKTTDIKAAFLQGCEIQRNVFLQPPIEADDQGNLWKLKKVVYGLNDAARHWFFTVKKEIEKLGCVQSKFDPAMFYWKRENILEGLFVIHVDDFIHSGTTSFEKEVVYKLRDVFRIGKIEENYFKYVGLNIQHNNGNIEVSQNDFIDSMQLIPLSPKHQANKFEKLNSTEIASLQICWSSKLGGQSDQA